MNVERFQKLQCLRIDGNTITSIKGVDKLSGLEVLSWREQRTAGPQESGMMLRPCEDLSTLFLSGNRFGNFSTSTTFQSLRHLELASAGLEALGENFGRDMPNLRSLNLNCNAIEDLGPLLGICKLQKLWLAGNRVSRLRRTALILKEIGQELTELDLRSNILTIGFYMPLEGNYNTERGLVRISRPQSQHEQEREDQYEGQTDEITDGQYLIAHVRGGTDSDARQRLDEDTALRRRVYEMMVVHSCPQINFLDGMEVSRQGIAHKDQIWRRLVELGILKGKDALGTLD